MRSCVGRVLGSRPVRRVVSVLGLFAWLGAIEVGLPSAKGQGPPAGEGEDVATLGRLFVGVPGRSGITLLPPKPLRGIMAVNLKAGTWSRIVADPYATRVRARVSPDGGRLAFAKNDRPRAEHYFAQGRSSFRVLEYV